MDDLLYLVLLVLVLFINYKLLFITAPKCNIEHKNQLPSPPGLPIIGHFHLLKLPLYRVLNNLSNKYGPIFLLRLGSRPTLVLSSRSVIEECFTKNDIIFVNRPRLPSRKISTYNFTTTGSAPYGNHWRNLRRFCALEIFSSKRLQMSSNIRTEELKSMIKHLFKSSFKGAQKVDVYAFVNMLDFNIMMRMFTGDRCFEFEEEGMDMDMAKAKLDDFWQIFSPRMTTTLGDYFPFLRWLAYFGMKKKLLKLHKKRDAFLQNLLDANRNNCKESTRVSDGEINQTIINVMLKLQESEPEFYTDNVIKGFTLSMLMAGTHTTVMTMASVISQLISNPEILKKAREEIDNNVGQSRLLNDADLPKLAYLHCIINETLRLDSAKTLIPPRESSQECSIAGYNIPGGTQLFVNIWAVHMDPELWEDPDKFKPERFQKSDEEVKGGGKFIPFGLGRRQCPGAGLAMRILALSLGTLIQCFEWEKAEDESHGVVKTKQNKLEDGSVKIIFRPRKELIQVLDQL